MNKVLISLLAGIVVGIFIAPAKGSESWKKVTDQLDEFATRASEAANHLFRKGQDKFEQEKSELGDMASEA